MSTAARRLEEDREFCHVCNVVTSWKPIRGGKRLRCIGCGDLFPCRSMRCGHTDCATMRKPKKKPRAVVAEVSS